MRNSFVADGGTYFCTLGSLARTDGTLGTVTVGCGGESTGEDGKIGSGWGLLWEIMMVSSLG